jgi:cysteine desulfurase
MGMAIEQVTRDISNRIQHLERLTGLFENEIQSRLPGVIIQGLAADRLPGTSMLSHPGLSHSWLSRLSGVDASSGSACASLHEEPSAVLLAMGVSADMAANSLRISFGAPTREEDALAVAQEVITSARALLA